MKLKIKLEIHTELSRSHDEFISPEKLRAAMEWLEVWGREADKEENSIESQNSFADCLFVNCQSEFDL